MDVGAFVDSVDSSLVVKMSRRVKVRRDFYCAREFNREIWNGFVMLINGLIAIRVF